MCIRCGKPEPHVSCVLNRNHMYPVYQTGTTCILSIKPEPHVSGFKNDDLKSSPLPMLILKGWCYIVNLLSLKEHILKKTWKGLRQKISC